MNDGAVIILDPNDNVQDMLRKLIDQCAQDIRVRTACVDFNKPFILYDCVIENVTASDIDTDYPTYRITLRYARAAQLALEEE